MTAGLQQAPVGPRDAEAKPKHPESLRRELLAIFVLYLAMAVLPFLVGWLWAP